ncbi:MAG TPA: HAMP domain-containing sensor histidine kinase [Sphingobium sp.]|uniref:HAMP domain-containing sensor histidine kinase n=1 Tax=Sphingobium sp. TaxID=1912891 RepID=UPI002ED3EAEF
MPRYSLRSLTLVFLLLFLLATVLTGIAIHSASITTIRQLVDQRVMQVSLAVAPEGERPDPSLLIHSIDDLAAQRDTGDLGFVLLDPGGRQIGGNMHLPHVLPPGQSSVDVQDNIKGLSRGRALVRDIPGGLRLIIVAKTEPFDDYESARTRIYLIGLASITAIVLGGLLLFSRMVSRRITQMRRTVDTIIDGDMDQRVPVIGNRSEFDGQAEAFNRMLDRIQALMAEIQNVSNGIAHELRTPLTRLRGKLALLIDRAQSDAEREGLNGALTDADELLSMFTAILRIAEVEGGERRAGFAPVDLGELACEIVAVLEPVAEDVDRHLVTGTCAPVTLNGDRKLLTQLLINLVENALRHTPVGSTVSVTVLQRDGRAEIVVSDDGPGIPADQRATALRRFARLDRHGSRGHGLGLPLIDAIARLHGGEMRLEDAGPGLRVRVSLPIG